MRLTEVFKVANKTVFNNLVDFETYPTSELNCINCNSKMSINFNSLKKHQLSNYTNLSKQDAKAIAHFVRTNLTNIPNSFLDYYCPDCGIATRLLYESWAGGKHGEYGFELKIIVTKAK